MRVHSLIERYRFVLLGAALVHFVVLHYFWIGMVSWDGYGHRLPPVIELLQHGSYGLDKFDNWAMLGFHPFIELINLPFLAVMGMDGFYFAYAAVMPLALWAMYALVREVSGDKRAALYAAAGYLLVPIVNSQLFSGYVDWSVPGLVAFYVYALFRAGTSRKSYAVLALATFLFTMARQQAPYLSILFFLVVMAIRFVKRDGLRPHVTSWKLPLFIALAGIVGLIPAAGIQIKSYLDHGTPIYPYQFNMLGIKIGEGATFKDLAYYAGVKEYSTGNLIKAFVAAWLVPATTPFCFFDSRNMGGGLFMITALLTTPFWAKRANFATRVLLATFVFTSLAGRDFWLPRYAYTLILVSTICTGLALSELLDRPKLKWLYGVVLTIVGLHALRPEWDIWRIEAKDYYPRLNASKSKEFIPGVFDLILFPDVNAKLLIVHWPASGFNLPLYGRKLTNSVVGNIPPAKLGEHCEGVNEFRAKTPDLVLVDVEDLTKNCPRQCVIEGPGVCLGWKLTQ